MKREGRQHGVVRSYPVLPTPLSGERRYVKTVDSASVTGLFTKVSRKPTNHSKFTGKCGTARCTGCHIHPVCKSKDKAKGTMKLRSIGNDRSGLIDHCPSGTSAIATVAYLCNDETYDDYDYNDDASNNYNNNVEFGDEVASINVREVVVIGVKDEDEHTDDEWYLVGHLE